MGAAPGRPLRTGRLRFLTTSCVQSAVRPQGTAEARGIGEGYTGPDKSVNHERVPAGATIVGFRFRPGAASQWPRMLMSSLVDQRVELTDLWGWGVRDTGDALASAGEVEVVAKLGAYLQDRARSVLPPDRMAQDIFDALAVDVATDGEITRSHHSAVRASPYDRAVPKEAP